MQSRFTYQILAGLSAAAITLLVVSGVPTFEDADSGWKQVVGEVAWGGFILAAVALIAFAVATLLRRRRTAA
jgi:biotin transporter BioY